MGEDLRNWKNVMIDKKRLAAFDAIGTVEEYAALMTASKESNITILYLKKSIEYGKLKSALNAYEQAEQEGRVLPDCKECKNKRKSYFCVDCAIRQIIENDFFSREPCENHFEPAAKEDK